MGISQCPIAPAPANQVGKGLTHPHPRKKERMFDGGGYYRPAVWENASCPRAQAVLVPACRRVTGSKKWTSGSDECDEKFCFSFLGFQKRKNSVGRRWAWRGEGEGEGEAFDTHPRTDTRSGGGARVVCLHACLASCQRCILSRQKKVCQSGINGRTSGAR